MAKIKSAERTLRLLELIANHYSGLSFTEIQNGLNIPKSSTYSLIQELLDEHYLLYNAQSKKYYAGMSFISLCSSYIQDTDFLNELSLLSNNLGQELNMTAHTGILDHTNVIYLSNYKNNSAISLMQKIGQRIPAHCTALGKILLTQYSNEQLTQMYANYPFVKLTEKSIDNLAALLETVSVTRKQGYAVEVCEASPYSACLALPLIKGNEMIAAFSISMPLEAFESCNLVSLLSTMNKHKTITEQRLFSF